MSSLEDADFMALGNQLSAALQTVDDLKSVLDVLKARVDAQENEIADHKAKVLSLIMECAKWRHLAEEKIALRREIEEALGIKTGSTNDEALAQGINAIRDLQAQAKKTQDTT